MSKTIKLSEYLDGMKQASSADELEAAIQAPFKHDFAGPTWSRICKARIEAGRRICDMHPHGLFVPAFGEKRRLTVCGESYRVGRGQNSAGVRYAWTYAQEWAEGILRANGFSRKAAHDIWSDALEYPHRALRTVEKALAGGLPDPSFNELIFDRDSTAGPVKVNRETEVNIRAHRDCVCGDGWLWDWGVGWTGWCYYLNWHCDRCPKMFGEYVTDQRLGEIRSLKPVEG